MIASGIAKLIFTDARREGWLLTEDIEAAELAFNRTPDKQERWAILDRLFEKIYRRMERDIGYRRARLERLKRWREKQAARQDGTDDGSEGSYDGWLPAEDQFPDEE